VIPGGPVETYLKQLRARLPYPAPRLMDETREHLVDAVEDATRDGLPPQDAELRAVRGYGAVDEVVAAVMTEGSALMSPHVTRWILPLAGLLTIPAAIFMFTNGIEHLAGSDGSEGVFGAALDRWQTPMNALLIFGPIVALGLIALATVRVQVHRSNGGIDARLELRMSRGVMFAALGIGLVVAGIVVYGVTENLTGPGAIFGGDWSCTMDAQDRMACTRL
jgi:hypothetical protein